jgi:hypothetical protein
MIKEHDRFALFEVAGSTFAREGCFPTGRKVLPVPFGDLFSAPGVLAVFTVP